MKRGPLSSPHNLIFFMFSGRPPWGLPLRAPLRDPVAPNPRPQL